jgi:hypothetical protein
MHRLPLLAALVLVAAAPAGAAPSLTLNGVSIDGATSQTFDNCTVVIDAQGGVHITAKGYAVKSDPSASAAGSAVPAATAPVGPVSAAERAGPAPKLTRRYFLATEQTEPDGTQYDVEVFINASWVRSIRSADPQAVLEVTRYLKPGPNKITLAAAKKLAGVERRRYTTDVNLKVIIGEGNVGGDHVMIDQPLVLMTRTAAEVEDRTEEYTVEAR